MDHVGNASTRRRRRVERGKRSKSGCRTCLRKRVKCDEQHPHCGRCIRLQQQCEWAPPMPPLASRRRGLGPIKERSYWVPQLLLPKDARDNMSGQKDSDPLMAANPPEDGLTAQLGPDAPPELIDSSSQAPEEPNSIDLGIETTLSPSTPTQVDGDTSSDIASCIIRPRNQQHNSSNNRLYADVQLPVSLLIPFNFPSMLFSSNFLVAASSLSFATTEDHSPSISRNDAEALTFHRMVFAPLKSARTTSQPAHSVFLNRAFKHHMALHFLLAVSHSELALYHGRGVLLPQESCMHFQRGSQLFIQALEPFVPVDHVCMMLSFLYMYMFWMRRDQLDPETLRELSTSILMYIKFHDLDELCASANVPQTKTSSTSDQVLLSRIFTYIYDRDGFCGFFGWGGSFASYVNENHDKRRRIWGLSRTAFLWLGNEESLASRVPEVQDAAIQDMYFHLIMIHHEINRYSQGTGEQALGLEMEIQRRLEWVREEGSSLFDLAANYERESCSPPLMGLVTVTFFHALQIYLHRSRNSAFGEFPVPPKVQTALSDLVRAAYRTMARGSVQLLERFQWALLIAGIETHDPVHRAWVATSILDPSIKKAFHIIQAAKGTLSISMRAVRQLVSGGCRERA